ncbi:MAG: WYL domain-containing protein [Eubacterium sp.]|nr:WYL domain-containing protein [Eubacterium sp.]
MNINNSTSRLLTILKFLNENIAEHEPIVIKELLEYLHKYGHKTERCTLIKDLNALEAFNIGVRHKNRKYYYQKTELTLEELMLLSDAISCSNYIDEKNTEVLIKKLKTLTTVPNSERLNSQLDICVKPKQMNPLCISNAGNIHKAISGNKQISFGYLHYNKEKQLIRKENYRKTVSPYKLVWDNSQYYLIAVDDKKGNYLVNYRVDKLFDLKILDNPRKRLSSDNEFYCASLRGIDTEKYLKSIFFMFASKDNKLTKIKILIHESVIGAFADKFGKDFPIVKSGKEWVEAIIFVQLSDTFFGWIFQFGSFVKILTPEIQAEYMKRIKDINDFYR